MKSLHETDTIHLFLHVKELYYVGPCKLDLASLKYPGLPVVGNETPKRQPVYSG